MSNHIHMLIHDPYDSLARFMHRLNTSYAVHFNRRHERIGHLFQDRFLSVPIESEAQLIYVVRYIHRNPLSIPGINSCKYRWSSFLEYLEDKGITTRGVVLSLFDSKQEFAEYHEENTATDAVETSAAEEISDECAIMKVRELLGARSLYDLKAMFWSERNRFLSELKQAIGSISQIERLTGVSQRIVLRA